MCPIDPGGFEMYLGDEVARAKALPTEALIEALREKGYRVESATLPPVPMLSDDAAKSLTPALLWFADEGHAEACGMSIARKALGLPVDRPDNTLMPLSEALAQSASVPTERTPEVVLRAMLAAYEAAALEAEKAFYRAKAHDEIALTASEHADAAVGIVRSAIAMLCAYGTTNFDNGGFPIARDYKARLAGTRPLDAPPLEET